MEESKTPLFAAILAYGWVFMIYQWTLNREGGVVGWLLALTIPAIFAAGAFFAAKKFL